MSAGPNADALSILASDLACVADTCRDIDRRDIAMRLARASRQLAKIADDERNAPLFDPKWSEPAAASRHF